MRKTSLSYPDVTSDIKKRFWKFVSIKGPDECWEWTGYKTSCGYGRFSMFRTSYLAHKLSFFMHGGVLTKESPYVLHSCHNPCCVSPHHLRAGNQYENMQDMIAAGREVKARGERHWTHLYPEKKCFGERNGRAKLSKEQVEEIRQRYAAGGIFQYQLAAEYGVTQGLITKIICKRNWA